jgi:8-oxo-dGTP pyrophosphatase MutT (NUDIX family)
MKKLAYKIGYPILQVYWFLFRPHTYGSKVVIAKDGKVLLVKQSYGTRVWCFPGGGQKRGETLEETAIRETKEEVGIDLGGVRFIGSFVSEVSYKHDHVHVYLAEVPSDVEVHIDGVEILEYEWATHDTQKAWTPHGEEIWKMYLSHERTR